MQDGPPSLKLCYAVLQLCTASVSMGQTDAAYVHLKFLTETTRNTNTQNPIEYRLKFQLRGCDLRYAMQSGKRPLRATLRAPLLKTHIPEPRREPQSSHNYFSLSAPSAWPFARKVNHTQSQQLIPNLDSRNSPSLLSCSVILIRAASTVPPKHI